MYCIGKKIATHPGHFFGTHARATANQIGLALARAKVEAPFLRCFSSFFFILGELCPGLVLVSSPVAKCAYKQHRYRNKCIAMGSIYAWTLSVGGVSPSLNVHNSDCIIN